LCTKFSQGNGSCFLTAFRMSFLAETLKARHFLQHTPNCLCRAQQRLWRTISCDDAPFHSRPGSRGTRVPRGEAKGSPRPAMALISRLTLVRACHSFHDSQMFFPGEFLCMGSCRALNRGFRTCSLRRKRRRRPAFARCSYAAEQSAGLRIPDDADRRSGMMPDLRKRIELVTNMLFSDLNGVLPDRMKPHATPWIGDDKELMRMLYVPEGMSVEEARKVVGDASPDR